MAIVLIDPFRRRAGLGAAPAPGSGTGPGVWSRQRRRARRRLNGRTILAALFTLVVAGHWFEHALQAVQLYVLDVPHAHALGALGAIFPGLVQSEWLHLVFNLAVLAGLAALRTGFAARARTWWTGALALQTWHLLEHALLFAQAQSGARFFGTDKPSSVLQLLVPRVELHLAYNGAVTVLVLLAVASAVQFRSGGGERHAAGARRRQRRSPASARRAWSRGTAAAAR